MKEEQEKKERREEVLKDGRGSEMMKTNVIKLKTPVNAGNWNPVSSVVVGKGLTRSANT